MPVGSLFNYYLSPNVSSMYIQAMGKTFFQGQWPSPQLERMRWLLRQAGEPQSHYPTVHIVGTNGKGSTTSYLQNILTKSGYQVGTFTSPYITRFNERISINGTEIPDKDLISLSRKLKFFSMI